MTSHLVPPDDDHWHAVLETASTSELLAGYARTLEVLRSRGVIRSANAPSGDYAEWLVLRALGGTLAPNSTKSFDITDDLGRRIQVKARVTSDPPLTGQLQTSPFRSWSFDAAAFVLLRKLDYTVLRATLVPSYVFDEGRSHARWTKHVNGWIVFMTEDLLSHGAAEDITDQVRAAAGEP